MAISSYFLPIFLLFTLSFPYSIAGDGSLFHICSNTANFTHNDAYALNLDKLTSSLISHAPYSGFAQLSMGSQADRTYGVALCRGDVSSANCDTCLREATSVLRKRCSSSKGGIIWYDYCLFKYSEYDFFGMIDTGNKFSLVNVHNVSDPKDFNAKTKNLLTSLANEAYENSRLFAEGEAKVSDSVRLYGLVQCSRDLSGSACKLCLDGVLGELKPCCDGREGGRVISGSCNFRFEIYPFTFP